MHYALLNHTPFAKPSCSSCWYLGSSTLILARSSSTCHSKYIESMLTPPYSMLRRTWPVNFKVTWEQNCTKYYKSGAIKFKHCAIVEKSAVTLLICQLWLQTAEKMNFKNKELLIAKSCDLDLGSVQMIAYHWPRPTKFTKFH